MSHELSHLAQKQRVSLFHAVWTAQQKVVKGHNYYHNDVYSKKPLQLYDQKHKL